MITGHSLVVKEPFLLVNTCGKQNICILHVVNCQILLQGDSVLHNWTQGVQEASTGEVGSPITIPSSFWQPQVEPVQGEVNISLKLAPLDNSHLEERSVARSGLNTDSAQQLTLHKSSGNSSQLNFYDLRAHAQDLPVTESSHGNPVQLAVPM